MHAKECDDDIESGDSILKCQDELSEQDYPPMPYEMRSRGQHQACESILNDDVEKP